MEILIPLFSLIALEVILGIDNIIFISILADKLPENRRAKLRYWGIGLAMVMRLILLAFRQRIDFDYWWFVFTIQEHSGNLSQI